MGSESNVQVEIVPSELNPSKVWTRDPEVGSTHVRLGRDERRGKLQSLAQGAH
jgi:hypothetical protein